jgi:hypothetical protein
MTTLLIRLGTIVLLFSGCASGPKIFTNANPGVDISSYSTYNFMQPLGTDRQNGVRTPLSTMLMNSIGNEMAARGLEQSNSSQLLINVYLSTEEKTDVRQTPTTGGYYGYRGARYSAWGGTTTTVSQYTQGTLAIDIVDAANNVLAWEGIAQARMSGDVRETTQERSDEVVSLILADFLPPPAAGE